MMQYSSIHRSYLKPGFNLPYTIAHGVTLLVVVAAFYLINFSTDKPLATKKAGRPAFYSSAVPDSTFIKFK